MPSGISDFGSATWLAALFGALPLPKTYWMALCLDEPGPAVDGDMLADLEPADPSYTRQAYPAGGGWWDSNGPYLTNTADITFPLPAADWGYVTHFVLCNAPTSGDIYAWGELLSPQYVTDSVAVSMPAGTLVLGLHTLDNSITA